MQRRRGGREGGEKGKESGWRGVVDVGKACGEDLGQIVVCQIEGLGSQGLGEGQGDRMLRGWTTLRVRSERSKERMSWV